MTSLSLAARRKMKGPSARDRCRIRWFAQATTLACVVALGGCGHVQQVFSAPGAWPASTRVPTGQTATDLKRVAVVAWAPPGESALANVLAAVSTDYLKMRKNYLLAPSEQMPAQNPEQPWRQACRDRTEGVLFVRAMTSALTGEKTKTAHLRLSSELYRCEDGALLFRSEGGLRRKESDSALAQMRAHYSESLGPAAAPYVPCAFSLLQELLWPLADPRLSEADIDEKIEQD